MKTSNFANYKGNNGVSIAGKPPENYHGRQYKKLAPSYDIWKQYHDTHDYERYTARYFDEILSKLNPQNVLNELGEDAVLLCFEGLKMFCHRRLVAKWFKYNLNLDVNEIITSTNLECSSMGDKEFSPFYAKINFLNQVKSIEQFYQEAKRFNGISFPFKEAVNKSPSSFEVMGKQFSIEYLDSFYKYLWVLYFEQHSYYLDYINHFDSFSDKLKRNEPVCTTEIMHQIKLFGISHIKKEIQPFLDKLNVTI